MYEHVGEESPGLVSLARIVDKRTVHGHSCPRIDCDAAVFQVKHVVDEYAQLHTPTKY